MKTTTSKPKARKQSRRKSAFSRGAVPKAHRAKQKQAKVGQSNPSFGGLPEIKVPQHNQYISQFAVELGLILHSHDFFWRHDRCMVPKQDENGVFRLEEVSSQEFRSLIEDYCAPIRLHKNRSGKIEKIRTSLPNEYATATLLSRGFLKRLRPVRAFNQVCLPAFYGNKLALLPRGYDSEHQIYTAQNAFDYRNDLTLDDAQKFFDDLLAEFCFLAGDQDRAKSVIIAAGLTLFASHLIPAHSVRPNFLVNANSEGSGKTLLCKIPIIAVLGNAPAGTLPKDEDEMRKVLAAASLSASPVFFLDNVKGHLNSPSLEALSTSPSTKFRVLGQTKMQEAEHGLTVFITTNHATFSPDLRRRTLVIELFSDVVRPESRLIKRPLDDAALIQLRPDILGAFWALVQHWQIRGFPQAQEINQSFVGWSKIVGGILETAGYLSPCHLPAAGNASGDLELIHMEKLLNEMVQGTGYKVGDLVNLARHHHLFEWIVGTTDDPSWDRNDRSVWGRLLARFEKKVFSNKMRFVLLSSTARKLYGITPA